MLFLNKKKNGEFLSFIFFSDRQREIVQTSVWAIKIEEIKVVFGWLYCMSIDFLYNFFFYYKMENIIALYSDTECCVVPLTTERITNFFPEFWYVCYNNSQHPRCMYELKTNEIFGNTFHACTFSIDMDF